MKKRNYLVIGSGGREHAIVWKLFQSPSTGRIFVLPGNDGMNGLAIRVPIGVMDFEGILGWLDDHPEIDMTVVAPDDPLAGGLVDRIIASGRVAFGPTAAAAKIEASKGYAKELMAKNNIPTAKFRCFDDYYEASEHILLSKHPLVIKADGLALGKGVVVCFDHDQSSKALRDIMVNHKFGKAGARIVVEDYLSGSEVSILAFCDGKTIVPMVSSVDHKRVFDGDQGANTGGMGVYSPSLVWTEAHAEKAMREIFRPTVDGLCECGTPFVGVIYFGLMVDGMDINVVEYNARFGDPEAQAVLVRLESDLGEIFFACVEGRLSADMVRWSEEASVCIVAASQGYPGQIVTGIPIEIRELSPEIEIFFSGVRDDGENLLTDGGRVLSVVAQASTLKEARDQAYQALSNIAFKGMHYRKDILKQLD